MAYLLKDWKSVVTNYISITSLTFTKTESDITGKTLIGSVSATTSDGTTKGVASSNADVIVYKDSSDENIVYIYSTGTIYFPVDSSCLFSGCSELISINFGSGIINTINVTDMSGMFAYSWYILSLDLSSFNTSNVTNMNGMFEYADDSYMRIKSIIFPENFGQSATNMGNMFYGCEELYTLDLSSFNTSNVTDMSAMFINCIALTSLTLPSTFTTANVTNMYGMFDYCRALTSLDLSNFDMTKCTTSSTVSRMFNACVSLSEIYSPKNIQVAITLPTGTYYKVTGTAGSYVKDGDAITTIPVGTDSIHILKEVSMTLNANTGSFTGTNTGWTVSAPTATKTGLYGETLDSVSVTKSGYHIESWNTAANGTGTRYELTDAIPTGTTLYAQFAEGELPVTGVDVGIGTLIVSVLATLLLACGLVLVLNKKKRYK